MAENVKLTFDQLQQIDVTEKRLANIQNEINVAIKVLTETRESCEIVTKEKQYQEELLKTIEDNISASKAQYELIQSDIEASNKTLQENGKKSDELLNRNNAKSLELAEKEKGLVAMADLLRNKDQNLTRDNTQIQQDKDSIAKAKEAFLVAIETVVWK